MDLTTTERRVLTEAGNDAEYGNAYEPTTRDEREAADALVRLGLLDDMGDGTYELTIDGAARA